MDYFDCLWVKIVLDLVFWSFLFKLYGKEESELNLIRRQRAQETPLVSRGRHTLSNISKQQLGTKGEKF